MTTIQHAPSQRQTSPLALVAADLRAVETKMRADEAGIFPPLAEAFQTLIGSGGKRLRPAIALLATRVFAPISNKALALAAAVETLHTATLVHDDVIDNATLRRGNPTLNASWTAGATVLAGDFLFARAAAFAAETGHLRVISLFADTLQVICQGELRQLAARRQWDQPKDAYYERIYAKTASLFTAAAEGGALLGGADEPAVAALRTFGYNLGMAFQIVDDILDFTSAAEILGKPAGSDLRQGTVTLPLFYFMQETPDRSALLAQLQARNDDAFLDDLIAEIARSPAIGRAFDEAAHFSAQAQAALAPLPPSDASDALGQLAASALERRT